MIQLPNDDSEDLYIPLERPHIPFVADNIQQPPTESDDDNTIKDSSSDSDSSIKKNSKIRKKLVLKQTKNVTGKRKNYNIWSNDLQTDILTNCLVDCNVDQSNERVRSVESYNYKLGIPSKHIKSVDNNLRRDNLKNRRYTSKRKHNGAYITGKSHVNDSNENSETKTNVGNSRNILSLTTTIENSESEIATDIANKLFEEKEELICKLTLFDT